MKYIFLPVMLLTLALSGCSHIPPQKHPTQYVPLRDFTPTVQIEKEWSTQATRGATKHYLRLQPAIVNQTIFVAGYNGHVAAIDKRNGQIRWNVKTGAHLTSGMGADAGRLFVATSRGKILALDQRSGRKLWKTNLSGEILATPTATKGIVFVKSTNGALNALSQENGKILWRYKQTVPPLVLHISSQPKVAGNIVVAGFANGKVAALNLQNGGIIWIKTITQPKGATIVSQMADIDVSPIIKNGVIYIATYQGKIVALDLYSGRSIWQHKISAHAGMAVDNQHIYLSDAKSYIWAFDQKTGAVIWRQTQLTGHVITGPALYKNQYIVVVDQKGYLHWLSKKDGSFAARNHLDHSGALTPPIAKNGTLYTYTRNGSLHAFKTI